MAEFHLDSIYVPKGDNSDLWVNLRHGKLSNSFDVTGSETLQLQQLIKCKNNINYVS